VEDIVQRQFRQYSRQETKHHLPHIFISSGVLPICQCMYARYDYYNTMQEVISFTDVNNLTETFCNLHLIVSFLQRAALQALY